MRVREVRDLTTDQLRQAQTEISRILESKQAKQTADPALSLFRMFDNSCQRIAVSDGGSIQRREKMERFTATPPDNITQPVLI
jgi:hypothetical protein